LHNGLVLCLKCCAELHISLTIEVKRAQYWKVNKWKNLMKACIKSKKYSMHFSNIYIYICFLYQVSGLVLTSLVDTTFYILHHSTFKETYNHTFLEMSQVTDIQL
jgi:hypothetical protein